jgi:hypothetical protein
MNLIQLDEIFLASHQKNEMNLIRHLIQLESDLFWKIMKSSKKKWTASTTVG